MFNNPDENMNMDEGMRRMQEFFSRMGEVNEHNDSVERVTMARTRIKEAVSALVGLAIFWSDYKGTDPQLELAWISESLTTMASLTLSVTPTNYRAPIPVQDLANAQKAQRQEY